MILHGAESAPTPTQFRAAFQSGSGSAKSRLCGTWPAVEPRATMITLKLHLRQSHSARFLNARTLKQVGGTSSGKDSKAAHFNVSPQWPMPSMRGRPLRRTGRPPPSGNAPNLSKPWLEQVREIPSYIPKSWNHTHTHTHRDTVTLSSRNWHETGRCLLQNYSR